jgi:hypothetical protein
MLTWNNLSGAAVLAFRILWYLVIRSDYRRPFLRAAGHALKRGRFDAAFGIAFIGYHLIEFTREALRGQQNASFYSPARKDLEPAAPEREQLEPIRKSA